MNYHRAAILLCAALASQGCVSTHSYVDPQFHKIGYSDLTRSQPAYALSVKSEFQRNGTDLPAVDHQVLDDIDRSLRASGVVVPYEGKGAADGEISFVVNNVGSLGGAAAKGFGTGLTFGLVGSHVTDGYEITVRLTQGDVTEVRQYQHAIYSTVGNASGPVGVPAVSFATAFNQVVDDLVLSFIKDMQAAGRLLPKTDVRAR